MTVMHVLPGYVHKHMARAHHPVVEMRLHDDDALELNRIDHAPRRRRDRRCHARTLESVRPDRATHSGSGTPSSSRIGFAYVTLPVTTVGSAVHRTYAASAM